MASLLSRQGCGEGVSAFPSVDVVVVVWLGNVTDARSARRMVAFARSSSSACVKRSIKTLEIINRRKINTLHLHSTRYIDTVEVVVFARGEKKSRVK